MAPNLERALADSYYLLMFCTRVLIHKTGIRPDDQDELARHVDNIVSAQHAYCDWKEDPEHQRSQTILSEEQMKTFWKSFIALSNIAAPATIESIRYFFDVSEPIQPDPLPGRYHVPLPHARAPFSRFTFWALLGCLVTSLAWYIGSTTLKEFDDDYRHWLALSAAARPLATLRENPAATGAVPTISIFDANGGKVIEVNQRLDRLRHAFAYMLQPAAQLSAAEGIASTKSPLELVSGRTQNIDPTTPNTLQKNNGIISLPCLRSPDPSAKPLPLPLWSPCTDHGGDHGWWFETTQYDSIIADEFVHTLAELQAERSILWVVVLPMNVLFHPINTFISDPRKLFPEEGPARHMLLSQMLDSHVPIPNNLPPPTNQLDAIRQEAVLYLEALHSYVLPVLFGLLGACVQVVRTISSRIETYTYMRGAHARYWARLVLGMVAGPAITWLYSPNGQLLGMAGTAAPGSNLSIISQLPPLALAFVAGYAIEILFSILDRFIAAFKDPAQNPIPTRERTTSAIG